MTNEKVLHSYEAECSFLGAALLEGGKIINMALEYGARPEWFCPGNNRAIWSILSELHRAGNVADITTAAEHAAGTGRKITSDDFDRLVDKCHSKSHALYYLQLIKDKAAKREVRDLLSKYEERLFSNDTAAALIPELATMLGKIDVAEKRKMTPKDAVIEAVEQLKSARETGFLGIPSRWYAFQRVLSGYREAKMCILAGRPGQGKTTFMCNDSKYQAERGYRVGILSLEQTESEIRTKFIVDEMRANYARWLRGDMTDAELDKFEEVGEAHLKLPVTISDTGKTIEQVRAWIWDNADDFDIVWLDYLQHIKIDERDPKRESERVSNWSNSINNVAKDTGLPIVALSQFNRGADFVDNKGKPLRPALKHLRGSGSLEQDANQAIFIYQALKHGAEVIAGDVDTSVDVAKNRGASIGKVEFMFLKTQGRFETNADSKVLF